MSDHADLTRADTADEPGATPEQIDAGNMTSRSSPARSADVLQPDHRDRDAARDLLVEVLTAQRNSGHARSTAAGVSSHMRAASPRFNYTALDFRSFRDFLKDAAEHGTVTVTWPEPGSGLDAYIWLPGEQQRPPAARRSERPRRVRPELWRAFMNWAPAVERYWDRQHDNVVELTAGTTAEVDLVPIATVTIEQQIEWMRAFTAELDSSAGERPVLQTALQTARPAAAFAAVIRQFSATDSQWRDTLVRHVADVIEEWKATNKLVVDIFDNDGPKPVPSQRAGRAPQGSGELSDGEVRDRVIAAVRAMPMADVLQLRIPVEYLLKQ